MADTVAQNFMKVLAGGAVLFDFTGHVHATGLDLDSGINSTPPADQRIRWLRTSDGAVVADIYGFEEGGAGQLWLSSYARAPITNATSYLMAHADPLNLPGTSWLKVDARTPFASSFVSARAAGPARTIIDGTGNSDFARLPVTGHAMSAGGRIDGRIAPGPVAVLASAPVGAITAVTRTALGTYTITTGASAPSGNWYGAAMPQGFAAMGGDFAPLSATTFQVRMMNAAGALVDDIFTVVVAG